MAAASETVLDDERLFEQLERYPWNEDVEFQGGLSAILGSNASPERAEELSLRARCFYYSRKYGNTVDFDAYVAWRRGRRLASVIRDADKPANGGQADRTTGELANGRGGSVTEDHHDQAGEQIVSSRGPGSSTREDAVPYPTTFAHIVNLITTGEPIPGIKEVPDTVLEGRESRSIAAKRKKPWEKDEGIRTDGLVNQIEN